MGDRDMRRGSGRAFRSRAKEAGGNTAGLAAFAAYMLVMPLMILFLTLITDAKNGIGAIRQLILRELIAVGSIQIDGLVREGHEHQSQYAQEAYGEIAPKLACAELQPTASPCVAEPI